MLQDKILTDQQLIASIKQAFGDLPFPYHCGLHAACAKDDWISDPYTLRSITLSKDYCGKWWDVPLEHLRKRMMALSYLDSIDIEFYLPAYMVAIVAYPEQFDIPRKCSSSWQVMFLLDPHSDDQELVDYFYARFSRIVGEKHEVCRNFIYYVFNSSLYNSHAVEIAERCLNHEYWRKKS